MKNHSVSHNSNFLVRLDFQQNEVQLFDFQTTGNMKCLARIKPPQDQATSGANFEESKSTTKFTCLALNGEKSAS